MFSVAQAQEYLNTILNPQDYDDFCFNGVQIEGLSDVSKIAYGVSLNDDFIRKVLNKVPNYCLYIMEYLEKIS